MFSACDEYGCLLNLRDIGAKVMIENSYGNLSLAENVFDESCDVDGNYYTAPDGFKGLAFRLDLGSLYNISQFRLKNSRNSHNNDRYYLRGYLFTELLII